MAPISIDALQDLFLLFCNRGRKERVVLGLSDTMYKRRLSTAKQADKMTLGGFNEMLRMMPGVLSHDSPSPEYIFLSCVGPAQDKKFELTFDHFLDALASLAHYRYGGAADGTSADSAALRCLLSDYVEPLFVQLFGEHPDGSGGGQLDGAPDGDNGSVITTDTQRGARRSARLFLTPDGTMPAAAVSASAGPAAAMLVAEQVPNSISAAQPARLSVSIGAGLTASAASAVDRGDGEGGGFSSPPRAWVPSLQSLAALAGAGAGAGGSTASSGTANMRSKLSPPVVGRSGSSRSSFLNLSNTGGSSRGSMGLGFSGGGGSSTASSQVENSALGSAASSAAGGLSPRAPLASVGSTTTLSSDGGGSRADVAALQATVSELVAALERITAEAAALRKENSDLRALLAVR